MYKSIKKFLPCIKYKNYKKIAKKNISGKIISAIPNIVVFDKFTQIWSKFMRIFS